MAADSVPVAEGRVPRMYLLGRPTGSLDFQLGETGGLSAGSPRTCLRRIGATENAKGTK